MKHAPTYFTVAVLTVGVLFAKDRTNAPAPGNWPQWRGPSASGVDTRVELPTSWDIDTGENIRWRTPVAGLAHASPIVWEDRIYIATSIKPGEVELKVGLYGAGNSADDNAPHQWRLIALDRATGKVVWDTLAHEGLPRHARHTKASQCNSTPVTDGKHIVAIFGSEGLFCFDMDGHLRWRKDLGKMDAGKLYSPPALQWGFASSPVMNEGLIFVQCDVVSEQFLAAYRVEDGAEVWRTPRDEVGTWCTPAIDLADGRRQIIVNGYKHIGGYDLDTGKERWRLREGGDNPIPSPIFGHGLVYLTSAHGATRPMRAVRPNAVGDITPPDIDQTNEHIAWVHSRRGSYLQTPIVVGDLLYACHDTGVVTCFNARTGEVHYSERLASSGQGFSASPVSDGRHVYFASERGEVFPLPVGTEFKKPEPRSVGEICMATPAITNGMLIFRTRSHVLAVGKNEPRPKDSATAKPEASKPPRTFTRYLPLETTSETSANICIGDVNGDGHRDLILAKGRHWPLHNRILLNNGKGGFSKGMNLSDTPDRTYTAALADLDGDGTLDLVVSNDKPDRNRIYLNKGGQWIASGEFGDPSWSTRNLLLADLNGDSRPDLIIGNRKMPSYVCLNDGSGAFPSALKLEVESATTIAAADFDGDGALDLAIPYRDGGQSVVLWNDGSARFESRTPFGPSKVATRAIAVGDINGDGLPDIVAGDEKNGVFLYLNLGSRKFGQGIPLTESTADAYAIALADLNQNEALDIVVGYTRQRGQILWNDGSGKNFQVSEWNDGEGAVYGIAIADLDGDGWPDIAAARSDAPNGVWFSAPASP